MNRNTQPCRSCKYHGVASGDITCDYILIMKERRGCPCGPGCTRYEEGEREKDSYLGVLSIPEELKRRG